jgi:hypothetical protein
VTCCQLDVPTEPLSAAGTLASPSISPQQNCGSVLPIKWQLKDGSGAAVGALTSAASLKAVQNLSCTGAAPAGAKTIVLWSPTGGAAGGSTFRFGSNQFIFNWNTGYMSGPGCYELELQLNDGSAIKATIENLQ